MTSHIFRVLEVEPLQHNESIIDLSTNNNRDQLNQSNSYLQMTQIPQIFPPWIPSEKFNILKNKFELYIFAQHPCLPCSYCGRMMYPEKSRWIIKNDSITYPLIRAYPNLSFTFNPNPPNNRIPVCDACYKNPNRNYPPYLHPVPPEIERIPLWKRKYLSPIFLHSSLGRTADMNNYTTYRSFVGNMGYSKNYRSLVLYSGMLGAFLEDYESSPNHRNHNWFDISLVNGANWLCNNNPYISSYSNLFSSQDYIPTFPTATHILDDDDAPPFRYGDIVVPHTNFPNEVHNEDAYYTRLMAGFHRNNDETNSLPISINHPDLEALLFPDLFPNGHGHYKEMISNLNSRQSRIDTYGKYIKHRLLNVDYRFRLHHYWPAWSYLQLEKLRNHQNTQRILRQKDADTCYRPPTAIEIIEQSSYTERYKYNEEKTIPLPTFIRTGDTYFQRKLMHLNSMIAGLELPTIFITLTMAESSWTDLYDILSRTDNHDTIPTNRPLHTTLHFIHRLQSLKQLIWKNPDVSEWGTYHHFFERVEFQNRGAAHTHGVYWTTKSIEEMINNNTIRSDVPDPNLEPELYHLVMTYQIHTCNAKCGGPAPSGERCKKGFPRPYSPCTYYDNESFRYTYRCINQLDRWVVPYHAPTLLIWKAHMNAQYVTDKGLASYINKYIAKPEPSHLFNVKEGDLYHEYVHARRLGSMELMFLLLGEKICNSSIQVLYLTTDPPSTRSKAIMPISLMDFNDDDPYWKDRIEKYFARPNNEIFNNITYREYYEKYNICGTFNGSSRRDIHTDSLGNYVIRRITPILTRIRYLSIEHGELYFYQQLLLSLPWRSEDELKGNYNTYRDHFIAKFPEKFEEALEQRHRSQHLQTMHMINQFNSLIEELFSSLQQILTDDIQKIIHMQINSIKLLTPSLSTTPIFELPTSQYYCMQTIKNYLGPRDGQHYPYFFITGPAGNGKSFIINLITNELNNKNQEYLLMAPTGVAAQNIGGHTIHSLLRIHSYGSSYQTLAFSDSQFYQYLKSIKTLIIDEISMVSSTLFNYISQMFSYIHHNVQPFGGINVIVLGDLAQLPPVENIPVYKSSVWKVFYPLFLREPQRQNQDPDYYKLLQNIRMGNIDDFTWNMLQTKFNQTINSTLSNNNLENLLNTTHIIGYKQMAKQINQMICNMLPIHNGKYLISNSIDIINGKVLNDEHSSALIKQKTNLPSNVCLQVGARVMFLNNSQYKYKICNGTIGIITDINTESQEIRCAFCVQNAIVDIAVKKYTASFIINGAPASRTQFPLINAFALTVHKVQGLTLPDISLSLDSQMFEKGQAYTAISRCSSWNNVKITSLSMDAFAVDKSMIKEYERLEAKASTPLPLSRSLQN
jgi:DNA replication protein DnaC